MDTILGPLLGVALGFLLSQLAIFLRESTAKRKESNSIRRLLYLEPDQNLNLLEDYWQNVSLPPRDDEPDENQTDRLVRRSKEIPYPPLYSIGWQSHIGKLSEVLNENELKECMAAIRSHAQPANSI